MPSLTPFDEFAGALAAAGVRYAVGGSWASTAFGEPRFTNDVDVLVDFTEDSLRRFFKHLPAGFYADLDQALVSMRVGRPFNLIHLQSFLKFDLFPAAAFALGADELDRAITLEINGLSSQPVRFVTPEDVVLAKLNWYRSGGNVSEVQWRDILGILRSRKISLDWNYVEGGARKLGLTDALARARGESQSPAE